jgi:hypothetical protein
MYVVQHAPPSQRFEHFKAGWVDKPTTPAITEICPHPQPCQRQHDSMLYANTSRVRFIVLGEPFTMSDEFLCVLD